MSASLDSPAHARRMLCWTIAWVCVCSLRVWPNFMDLDLHQALWAECNQLEWHSLSGRKVMQYGYDFVHREKTIVKCKEHFVRLPQWMQNVASMIYEVCVCVKVSVRVY